MSSPEKNARIREKRKGTLLRRKSQDAKTYELKFDRSKISNEKLTLETPGTSALQGGEEVSF